MPLGRIIDTNELELDDHPHELFEKHSGKTVIEDPGYSLNYSEIEPGGIIRSHAHRERSEGVLILEGKARMQIGQQAVEAGPGYFGWGPKNVVLEIENIGDTTLRQVSIFSPPFDHHDLDESDRSEPVNPFSAPVDESR